MRYEALQRALLTLEHGLEAFHNDKVTSNHDVHNLMRDGVIQRFEYSIDSFWKFFKLYLEIDRGMVVEPSSPRVVLRASLASQLVTQEEYDVLEDCVADRNLTSHTYNEKIADKIYAHIPRYHMTMKAVVGRVKIG